MSQHLISKPAVETTCPRCRRSIMVATDRGLPARVDAAAITAHEEIAALVEGRDTYERLGCGELVLRELHRIRAGPPLGTIHAEHRCARQPSLFEPTRTLTTARRTS